MERRDATLTDDYELHDGEIGRGPPTEGAGRDLLPDRREVKEVGLLFVKLTVMSLWLIKRN